MKKQLKVLVVSDTHEYTEILDKIAEKEEGDIFIHGGDFTYYGVEEHFDYFCKFLSKLRFRHKIVISGNHEISLDNGCIQPKRRKKYLDKYPCSLTREQILDKLKPLCTYLEHSAVIIEGLTIFGSPYTPYYVGNAFKYDEKYDEMLWDQIPAKVDILVTHCPPYKIMDLTTKGVHGGSKHLRKVSELRKPQYHIFGHIHESFGQHKVGQTVYINASMYPTCFMVTV